MPNTITSIFVSNPATEPVEAPHPNTGVYVTGTQATVGGPWTVVHTLITKTATPLTMVGRLKNFPTVTVSVVATGGPNGNGNIFNNVLATPTGAAATATSSTALSVAVSSIANQTAYRLLSATTAAGPFSQIYQGTGAIYPHGGLTAAQTVYYKWQYVGGGYYDDSPLSAVFSGATSAVATYDTTITIPAGATSSTAFGVRLTGPVGAAIRFNQQALAGQLPQAGRLLRGAAFEADAVFQAGYAAAPFQYVAADGTIYNSNIFQNNLTGVSLAV